MTTPPLDLPALREYTKELERDGARSGTIRTDPLRALLDRVENTESERDHWDKMARRALSRAELAEARAEDAEAAERDLAAVTVSRDGWKTRAEAAENKVAKVREIAHRLHSDYYLADVITQSIDHADNIANELDTALDTHTPETETTP